jgi:hypothetical protein
LRLQLDSVSAGLAGIPSVDTPEITDATAFAHATSELRAKAQSVNEEVVKLFAGSAADLSPAQARESIARLRTALPVAEASRMRLFAGRMTNGNTLGQKEMGETRPGEFLQVMDFVSSGATADSGSDSLRGNAGLCTGEHGQRLWRSGR